MVITIDGPVASGKSTAARQLAQIIGFHHFSSGLLYRALAYLLLKYAHYDQEKLKSPDQQDLDFYLDQRHFLCSFDEHGNFNISWKGTDLVPFLKHKDIDQCASIISTHHVVRERMLELQRLLGQSYNLVVDGRDSGSVVFPDAIIKFFLTASVEIRAQRWQQTQRALGNEVSLKEALHEIQQRDERDKKRKIAPLIIPKAAIIIDNSDYTLEQTVNLMVSYYKKDKGPKITSSPL